MERTIAVCGLMFVLVLAALAAIGPITTNIPERVEHITERGHLDALALLPAYQDGVCSGKWVGYSITRGQVMVKCRLPDTTPPKCLFVFYKVTENRGTKMMPPGKEYNPTCLVEECWKYTKEYQDWNNSSAWGWDNAGTWVVAPLDLKAAIISAFGSP